MKRERSVGEKEGEREHMLTSEDNFQEVMFSPTLWVLGIEFWSSSKSLYPLDFFSKREQAKTSPMQHGERVGAIITCISPNIDCICCLQPPVSQNIPVQDCLLWS